MSETLFDLTGKMNELVSLADSLDPEDEQAFTDTLDAVKGEIGVKLDAYKYTLDQIASREELMSKIAKEAQAKAAACKNAIDRMKKAAYEAVAQTPPDKKGKQYIEGDVYKFSIVKNGGKQPIKITGDVPNNYQRIVYETDTDKIRKALESGEELSFAHLEPRGTHLQIK